jgi:hypothetical protein
LKQGDLHATARSIARGNIPVLKRATENPGGYREGLHSPAHKHAGLSSSNVHPCVASQILNYTMQLFFPEVYTISYRYSLFSTHFSIRTPIRDGVSLIVDRPVDRFIAAANSRFRDSPLFNHGQRQFFRT